MRFEPRDLRRNDTTPHVVPVVNPHGCIVHVVVSNTVDPPMLRRDLRELDDGRVVLRSVSLEPGFEENGYTLLEADYSKDPDGKGKQRFSAYLGHMTYGDECERVGQVPDPFPTELLPQSVLERQRGEGPARKRWTPNVEAIGSAPAMEASPA